MRDSAVWRRATAVALLALGSALVLAAPPVAAEGLLSFTSDLNGTDVARTSNSDPVRLAPDEPAQLAVTVVNRGNAPATVRTIRLEGRVVGLVFFAYETSTVLQVAPGATESRRIELDLRGLEGQATGLMPASLQLLDDDRDTLASQSFIADIRGTLWSLYGLFGLAVVLLTALAFVGVVGALARQRLPRNRFVRGLRFAPVGLGLGLIAVFTLSVLRIWAAELSVVLVFAGGATVIAFLMGYLTPTPDDQDWDDTRAAPRVGEPVG